MTMISKIWKKLSIISEDFLIFKPKDVDKVFGLVFYKGWLGVGNIVSAFEYGFKVATHPFLEEELDISDVGLGQLTPDSFFNIITFIPHCFARKIE